MGNLTFEEMNLMCIYNTGSRTGLIDSLREMRGELSPEETELRELTDSALTKLCAMTEMCIRDRPYSAERRKAASERAKAAGHQPPVRKSSS